MSVSPEPTGPTAPDLDIEGWLDDHWDPELTVAEWWSRLAAHRLSHVMFPEPWGRGWSRPAAARLARSMTARGALGPPSGIGAMLAAPTLLAHGSSSLVEALVPAILDGRHGWCQLFSEPVAGSDLAGIQTRAVRDGDEWIVSGQKVWTSLGQWADYGILIARTDPDAPKHRGITYFAFPMRQDGVEVRPLREMTGRSLFNEVFLDGARVRHDHVIGQVDGGWRVANTTLMVERRGIGGASITAPSAALPGTVSGHLGRPAGSFQRDTPVLGEGSVGGSRVAALIDLASEHGKLDDPIIRQDIARLHTLVAVNGWHLGRMKSGQAATGVEGNLAKIRNSAATALARDVGCRILGSGATVMGRDAGSGGTVQSFTLFSPAPSIYGGTDQVQRNIIGERGLGLPKEPGPGRDTPFRELPPNV